MTQLAGVTTASALRSAGHVPPNRRACSHDQKSILECDFGTFKTATICRGPRGCYEATSGTPICDIER